MRPLLLAGASAAVAVVAVSGFLMVSSGRHAHPKVAKAVRPIPTIPSEPKALSGFVSQNAASKDKETQDLVGAARLRLAYHAAKGKDFAAARKQFQTTAKEYRGTGAQSADWGGIPDQAAYQAAACLVAEGKTAEAKQELVAFMRDRAESPLVHAAYKRLVRMNRGKPTPEYEELLQTAVAKQEAKIRFETSVCGPRAIEYLLVKGLLPAKGTHDYRELARLCGTTDRGTTVDGMRKGLKAIGVPAVAYRLSRRDLADAPMPAILLEQDHYLVVLSVSGDAARVYDSRYRQERTAKLPPLDDPDFAANLILFSAPTLSETR